MEELWEGDGAARVLEAMDAAVVILDHAWRYRYVNDRASRLMGITAKELMGRTLGETFPEMTSPQNERVIRQVIEEGVRCSFEVHIKVSGVWLLVDAHPVDRGMALHCTDISRYKHREMLVLGVNQEMERLMVERTNELSSALNKARALSEERSRFLAMAAHELRSPLTTVLSSLSLMERYRTANDPAKEEQHRTRIHTMVSRMMDMLNDMIYLEYAERIGDRSDPERIDLHEFFSEVVTGLDGIQKPGQHIVLEHDGNLEMHQDRRMLKMVLTNLLKNAIKYSEEDIQVHTNVKDDEAVIEVIDAGIGIPSEDRKHLFERFFRANNARELPGTGLGLSIAKRYTDRMQGTIDVASEEGKGSTFTLRLPAGG
jgi:PAS domain S-box-containing protein